MARSATFWVSMAGSQCMHSQRACAQAGLQACRWGLQQQEQGLRDRQQLQALRMGRPRQQLLATAAQAGAQADAGCQHAGQQVVGKARSLPQGQRQQVWVLEALLGYLQASLVHQVMRMLLLHLLLAAGRVKGTQRCSFQQRYTCWGLMAVFCTALQSRFTGL